LNGGEKKKNVASKPLSFRGMVGKGIKWGKEERKEGKKGVLQNVQGCGEK